MLEQLEINCLSLQGEQMRQILCLSGRVSVFRSRTEEQMGQYKAALLGDPSASRFQIYLNSESYNPSNQYFVGFGEQFSEQEKKLTVAQFICQLIGEECYNCIENLEGIFLQFGLGGIQDKTCEELTEQKERMLRIFLATFFVDRVVLLNDPFSLVEDEYKELYAELIAKYSWYKKTIVVVLNLNYRPKNWIENAYVSRVQLEKPRSGTIGFGSGGYSSQEIVKQVRENLRKSKEEGSSTTAEEGERTSKKRADLTKADNIPQEQEIPIPLFLYKFLSNTKLITLCTIIGTSFIIISGGVALFKATNDNSLLDKNFSTIEQNIPVETSQDNAPADIPDSNVIPLPGEGTVIENTPPSKKQEVEHISPEINIMLVGFPDNIKKSVMMTIGNPEDVLKKSLASEPKFPSADSNNQLVSPGKASTFGDDLPEEEVDPAPEEEAGEEVVDEAAPEASEYLTDEQIAQVRERIRKHWLNEAQQNVP